MDHADRPAPSPLDDAANVSDRRIVVTQSGGVAAVGVVGAVMRTEGTIYGTVLALTLIAVGFDKDTDLDVLLFLLGSVSVFWVAHLYAGTLSRLPEVQPDGKTFLAALRDTARHSIGMLAAMVVPAAFLALGPLNVLDEWTAYYLALASGVVILAVLGYLMSARRGSPIGRRLLGTLTTTLLGFVVVWLSTLVH
ncbi:MULTISPECIES: hypothetical protein [unclassified Rathayibacter]|uniref:hypothetical protein n=1 Tax=unclassified Rathayibacter TaxID=2609250 RepID=UPI00188BC616|nr:MULTISPECIES: hypothetical protein [unclassified Rathayibacter]MBF4463219.1 hypothetical protein [Rathayibacter sp. VKM Ac-2879]MBF4504544.1 hypothetical protein [Rathayibacter sp. VKM Ac-2878]